MNKSSPHMLQEYHFGDFVVMVDKDNYFLSFNRWELYLKDHLTRDVKEQFDCFHRAFLDGLAEHTVFKPTTCHFGKHITLHLCDRGSITIRTDFDESVTAIFRKPVSCTALMDALDWYLCRRCVAEETPPLLDGKAEEPFEEALPETTIEGGYKVTLCQALAPFELEKGQTVSTPDGLAVVLGVDVGTGHLCVRQHGLLVLYPARNRIELEMVGVIHAATPTAPPLEEIPSSTMRKKSTAELEQEDLDYAIQQSLEDFALDQQQRRIQDFYQMRLSEPTGDIDQGCSSE